VRGGRRGLSSGRRGREGGPEATQSCHPHPPMCHSVIKRQCQKPSHQHITVIFVIIANMPNTTKYEIQCIHKSRCEATVPSVYIWAGSVLRNVTYIAQEKEILKNAKYVYYRRWEDMQVIKFKYVYNFYGLR
jgi:hypothetical protein